MRSTQSVRCSNFLPTLVLTLLLAVTPVLAQGQSGNNPPVRGGELVEIVTPRVVNVDLRSLPTAAGWKPGDAIKEIPRQRRDRPAPGAPANPVNLDRDPLLSLQEAAGGITANAFATPDINIPGQGFTGVNPPDTVGEVGANYYIQMINASGGAVYQIYDKTNGALVAGPTFLDTLGSGFCGNGLGDPIALYDHLAGRWMLSEFSSSGNRLCVYVSQTGDPIAGGWYFYEFAAPSFPDYPKYGVWSDAYYVTSNESQVAIYALERAQMLVGGAASSQRFTAPDLGAFGFQTLTATDLDGPAPPAGAPGIMIRHNDDEAHEPSSNDPTRDFLEIFELSVDFATPANSTFTGPIRVPITEIDSEMCGFTSFSCVPQPGTNTRLDPLREVVMWRSQYRNFGSHETLVGSLVTDTNGSDLLGVRWYELRKAGGGGWSVFQEGTYSIDSDNRFMPSAAMDGSGNIAVGYNVSSSSTFPSLRYAGRLASDALGTLPQGEATLVNGSASNGSNRYGDYSSLNVDPIDECTFWFTGEYNTSSQWSTRIGSFSFPGCGGTCGNGIIEGGEVCDGGDLGGATCGSEGCGGGGTLACNSTCTGFDTSGCLDCPICDNDGVCEAGEDCTFCGFDCPSGVTPGASCGNGICEAGDGEDCLSCPSDCNGTQSGRPANRFCCGDGDGQNPVSCGDARCSAGGFSCTNDPAIPGSFCCGDLACDAGESCATCALDCTFGAEVCTNGVDDDCDGDVDCDDLDCLGDPVCQAPPPPPSCGGKNEACSANSDCCSGVCKNNGRCR